MGETASAPGLYMKVADEAEERVTLDEALRRIGFGYAQERLGHTTPELVSSFRADCVSAPT